MPTVDFTKRIPPAAAGAPGRGTLAELMAKQKDLASRQAKFGEVQPIQSWTQGLAQMGGALMTGLQENRATQDLAAQQAAKGALMSRIDPLTGADQNQISEMQQYDPELATSLLADRASRQRALADAEHWDPATPEEKAALGAAPTDPIMRNKHTGEFKSLATGGNTTISTGDKVETEWGKQLAKGMSDTIASDRTAGRESATRMATMNQLEQLMNQGYTGNEAAISEYLRTNWGIQLGEKASATAAFSSIVDSLVPKLRVEGSGTTSDRDAAMFKNSLPDLMKSPDSNRIIMGYVRGLAQRDIEVARIAEQAGQMGDPTAARKFYYDNVSKLADPLADLSKTVEDIRKKAEAAAGGTGGTGDLNAPAAPAEAGTEKPPMAVNPAGEDPNVPVSAAKNADGSWTYTFKNGVKATVPSSGGGG